MTFKPVIVFATSFAFLTATAPIVPAFAGGSSYGGGHMNYGGMSGGPAARTWAATAA